MRGSRIFARPKSVTLASGTSSGEHTGSCNSTFNDFRSRCTTGVGSPCRYAMPSAMSLAILSCWLGTNSTSDRCSRWNRVPPWHISSTTSKVLAPWQKPSSRTRFGCRVRDITPSSRTKTFAFFLSSTVKRFTATWRLFQKPEKTSEVLPVAMLLWIVTSPLAMPSSAPQASMAASASQLPCMAFARQASRASPSRSGTSRLGHLVLPPSSFSLGHAFPALPSGCASAEGE
mmetsp:Transcript_66987/g.190040  ORF Transcript_66987/g.190040 Transcript_66987/m.190040 type:complete len:231 (+) Transcript_66987:1243-1935(+)